MPPSPATPTLVPRFLAASVSTTTVFTNPTNVIPAPPSKSHGSDNLIGPIVGGALGGVLLAVLVVLGWHWWGRSIKQKEDDKKQEMVAVLKLRENTRRNASAALEKGHDSYTAHHSRPSLGRTVKFSSSSSESNQSTLRSFDDDKEKEKEKETEKEKDNNDLTTAKFPATTTKFRGLLHAPVRSSPLAQRTASPPPNASSPTDPPAPVAARTPSPEESDADQPTELPSHTGGLKMPPLVHKPSKASSISMYSTQSGEERQQLVPPSLITAAFRRPDPRRSLVDRLSAAPSAYSFDEAYAERNRLSNISAGSEYLQHDGDEQDSPHDGYMAR